MHKLIFILLFVFFQFQETLSAQSRSAKTDTLIISLAGKKYGRVSLRLNDLDSPSHTFRGKNLGNDNWLFIYPDSVYNTNYIVDLLASEKTKDVSISVCVIIQNDTMNMKSFGIPRNGKISLRFRDNITYNSPQSGSGSIDVFICQNPAFEVYFPLYLPGVLLRKPYSDYLKELQKLIRQYPDSHYLICCVFGWRDTFKKKDDLLMLYNTFPLSARNTYFGKKIKEHMNKMP